MELVANSFLTFLADPFRRHPRRLRLGEKGVIVRGGARASIDFQNIASKPSTSAGFLSSSLTMDLGDGAKVVLPAVKSAEARAFSGAVEKAWSEFNLEQLGKEEDSIRRLLRALEALRTPEAYPSACYIDPLARQAVELTDRVLSKLNPAAVGNDALKRVAPIIAFAKDPAGRRDAAITRFVDHQLAQWKDFFDNVESMPLTPEQRLSVVVDEDATLVLAGAGSGKTSVITAKAAYLLRAGIRASEELLLLAFAKDAAKEMSERIEARCGVPIAARTFHALAYEIIGVVEGEKPPFAPTATDDKAFLSLIAARSALRSIWVSQHPVRSRWAGKRYLALSTP